MTNLDEQIIHIQSKMGNPSHTLEEEEKLILQLKKLNSFKDIEKLNSSGYAGINKKGTIVDRRKNPDAIPIQENKMFGIPKPKTFN